MFSGVLAVALSHPYLFLFLTLYHVCLVDHVADVIAQSSSLDLGRVRKSLQLWLVNCRTLPVPSSLVAVPGRRVSSYSRARAFRSKCGPLPSLALPRAPPDLSPHS